MQSPNQFEQVSADDIAGDIVTYLYDQHPGASYIGDKEGQDGSVMLRFDWGNEDQAAIQNELKERYGERVAFTGGQLKYAPEIKLSFIRVLPVQPLTEAVNSKKAKTSITAVGKLELYVGDFSTQFFAEVYSKDGWTEDYAIDLAAEIEKQFKPGEIETEYLSPLDNLNDNRGGCTYQIVMNMNISISLSALDSRVQAAMYKFQSDPSVRYNDEGESGANVQTKGDIERQVADNIDTAMMDHYDMMNGDIGDFESTGFNAKVKALCDKAGKPALAEAIIKLRNLYKSQMEAGETVQQSDWRSEYGTGGIITHENSADGLFARPNHPIGYAILTNNTKMLTKLRSGKVKAKDAYNIVGFEEDLNHEGKYVYNFERGYEVEFEQDWERVVGETNNQDALRLMLQFVPDFWLCPIDFYNAFSAGYDKTLLATLLRNYPTPDDPYNSYLPWDGVSIDEVLQFLET